MDWKIVVEGVLFMTTIAAICEGAIHISPGGSDNPTCGNTTNNSCKTIGYVLKNRVSSNETLILDGSNGTTYNVSNVPLIHSLRIEKRVSSPSNPRITSQNKHLFKIKNATKVIDLDIDSVDFYETSRIFNDGVSNVNFTLRNSNLKGKKKLFLRKKDEGSTVKHKQISITLENNNFQIDNSIFIDGNESTTSELIIRNCSFQTSTYSYTNYIKSFKKVVISDVIFHDTRVWIQKAEYFTITNTTFKELKFESGSQLYISDAKGKISNCHFTNNSFKEAVKLYDVSALLEENTFKQNVGNYLINWAATAKHVKNMDILIKNSTFRNNSVYDSGFDIYTKSTKEVFLRDLTFTGNNASSKAWMQFGGQATISLQNPVFKNNNFDTVITAYNMAFDIQNASFIQNSIQNSFITTTSSKISISANVEDNNASLFLNANQGNVKIYSANFTKNIIKDSLIDIREASVCIEDVSFLNNTVENDIIQVTHGNINITGANITNNKFTTFATITESEAALQNIKYHQRNGDSIPALLSFEGRQENNRSLYLKNISVQLENILVLEQSTPVFEISITHSPISMENVRICMNEIYGKTRLKNVWLEMSRENSKTKPKIDVQCSSNYNPTSRSFTSNSTFHFGLYCNSCPRGQYSLNRGQISINGISLKTESVWKTVIEKEDTPRLGEPTLKKIPVNRVDKVIKSKKIPYTCHGCPPGGNCSNSRIISRDGFFGYTNGNDGKKSFVYCPASYCCSSPDKDCNYNICNHHREGTLCGSCSNGYYISYFSNNCVSNTKCSVPRQVTFWVIFVIAAFLIGYLVTFTNYIISIPKRLYCCIKKTKYREKPKSSSGIPFGIIYVIMKSFYQLKGLMYVPIKKLDSEASFISDILNVDFFYEQADTICPTTIMGPVLRGFFKSYLFPLLMLVAVASPIWVIFLHKKFSKNTMKERLISQSFSSGFIEVILLNYTNIANYTFGLLYCRTINNSNVLYMSGDVECYNPWQYVVILFMVFWVIPFPVGMIMAYRALRNGYINCKWFLFCLTCPPAAISLFIIGKYKDPNSRPDGNKNIMDKSSENILKAMKQKFENSFRQNRFWWAGWRLYERLIVACVTIYIVDPVVKLMALTPVIIFFLWLHYTLNPYKPHLTIIKFLDMTMYMFLCLNLVSNMFRAVVQDYALPHEFPVVNVAAAARVLEQIFTPLWPIIFIVLFKSVRDSLSAAIYWVCCRVLRWSERKTTDVDKEKQHLTESHC